MDKPPDRRKHLLIDQLQYRLLKVNVVYFVVIVAAFFSSLFGPLVLRLLLMNAPGGARERIAEQFLLIDDAI
ncbi:MAG: hypothetical protein O3A25_03645 [Acidobacteria bacterium]|nr:hypothetical protein [Acidobacteriota bacterium]